MRIQIRFLPLVLLLILTFVFASLGQWQIHRKVAKQDLLDRFDQAPEMHIEKALVSGLDFARVRILGRYEDKWHVLLDNKIYEGRPGVHVLSLFYPNHGTPLLVDRGWLAMSPDRRSLPQVTTPGEEVVISGLLSKPPGGGVKLGHPDVIDELQGSLLLTYLDIEDLARRAELPIAGMILKLDADESSGFDGRNWQPAVMLPAQHQAYAVQWFALAAAAIILIFTVAIRFSLKRSRQ
jgi:cytochrome oxidase assembly protein ShyY1